MQDNFMDDGSKGKSRFGTLILVIIILLLLGMVAVIGYKYYEKVENVPNDQGTTLSEDGLKNLESDLVYNDPKVLYSSGIIKMDNIPESQQVNITLKKFQNSVVYDCEGIKKTTNINASNVEEAYASCQKNYEDYVNNNYIVNGVYNVNYENLNTNYKNIYGLTNNLAKKDYTKLDNAYCFYKNGDIICFNGEGGSTSGWYDARFDSALKYTNYIEYYNYFAYCANSAKDDYSHCYDQNNNVLGDLPSDGITKASDSEFKKLAVKYKTIFKEDSNGNYYWYSTEPVTK